MAKNKQEFGFKDMFKLIRVHQWYKNLLVFLPLIFSQNILNIDMVFISIIAFISLCLISSSNYILNDIADLKSDKVHPEKKNRPLASGKIGIGIASVMVLLLAFSGFLLAYQINIEFFFAAIGLFVMTQLYSFYLKNETFADILLIALNFVIRAASGALAISVVVSPWIVLCPFFLALLLAIGKRESDLRLLGKDAYKHKKVLKYYTLEITKILMSMTTTLLMMSYSLYAVSGEHPKLLITLPFALYGIMRYFYLVNSGNIIARKPHLAITDIRLVISVVLWGAFAGIAIYF